VHRPKLRLVLLALVTAFVASLSCNAYLLRASLRYFEDSVALRLDPLGLKVYAAERAKPAPGSPVVVLFGDSRALMWSEPAALTRYHVVNRGIGYQTTAQILGRLELDVVSLRPDVVVLEAGVNDLKAIADFPTRRPEIVASCEANLERIVERCKSTGAQVIVVAVFDVGDVPLWRLPFWSSNVSTAVHEVNEFLARLTGPKVAFFDANPLLEDAPDHIRREYQIDYLHLTPAGYLALNRQLVPLLGTFIPPR
jgi:lysophospholipase L1-like esterase